MSPEPIRHEPGPRDWTPPGGYTSGVPSANARTMPATRTPPNSTSGPRHRTLALTALILGFIAIMLAAVYIPETEASGTSGTIILSTLGLIAIAAGVLALRTHRFGLRQRRGMANRSVARRARTRSALREPDRLHLPRHRRLRARRRRQLDSDGVRSAPRRRVHDQHDRQPIRHNRGVRLSSRRYRTALTPAPGFASTSTGA